ncbi:MAG: phosphotransferase [Anaerolineaceae bacterium]|nr:phosphotransferase [Anaerolineaceae bacterium]
MVRSDNAGGGLRGERASADEALLNAAREAYGIEFGGETIDLGGSSSLNLCLTDVCDRWVLRVYRPYVSADRLEAIHQARRALTRGGVPCDAVVRTLDGRGWITHERRMVELEHFIESDAEMDDWETLALGMPVLARMHRILETVEVNEAGRHPMFANYIAPEQVVEQTARGTRRMRTWGANAEMQALADEADQLARRVFDLEQPLQSCLPGQLTHGDFWDNNIFLHGGEVVFVTDFDFMGERARVDDLALTLYFTCMDHLPQHPVSDAGLARLRGLLEAYDQGAECPLSALERRAMPIAIARQPLWSIGGWVAGLDDGDAARAHAAATAPEVYWALQLLDELERWQEAFAG